MENLEFYGEIKFKSGSEGEGYYVMNYESPSTFDGDPELKAKFIDAKNAINRFYGLLNERIVELGGDPDEYEFLTPNNLMEPKYTLKKMFKEKRFWTGFIPYTIAWCAFVYLIQSL